MTDNLLFSRINVPAAVWSDLLGLTGKKNTISKKYFLTVTETESLIKSAD